MHSLDHTVARDDSYKTLLSTTDKIMQEHNMIKSDLYKLKAHLYEVCQQATGTNDNLCSRIKNSLSDTITNTLNSRGNNGLDASYGSPAYHTSVNYRRENGNGHKSNFAMGRIDYVSDR
ncbi:hypothetical protein QKV36_gp034 [Erannis ankeraria nucleopolyhedrovirus]|uniref:hypothetical protein n=1 Tax=Erannis ankeraria nucleopolyhedrovirus TaxID=2913600 RepID=UPI002481A516|nr:hypothetical protein QKV36_gp034 [Erannis ankeraria nucleopolyhedrovirus]UJZ88982.1 hypothetical protein Erangp034 [Erannis ankeraria nucleopolyhedrovirus]